MKKYTVQTIRAMRVESTSTNGRPRVEPLFASLELVPAEVAERLYEALMQVRSRADFISEGIDLASTDFMATKSIASLAVDALKFADEYGGGSDD